MRAVKIAFSVPDDCTTTASQLHYYINQLRYERLMAKAEMFKGECYTRWCASKTKKNLDTYAEQFHSLGKIYEERAKKIKDGMS